ncbi:MAG: hypothetical protein K1060chlam5_01291 [Candidatus Anoxychlamydiales bacterium]|nr:hypothetical protein [Candidatus Anoxychlamydiales bacterium]
MSVSPPKRRMNLSIKIPKDEEGNIELQPPQTTKPSVLYKKLPTPPAPAPAISRQFTAYPLQQPKTPPFNASINQMLSPMLRELYYYPVESIINRIAGDLLRTVLSRSAIEPR